MNRITHTKRRRPRVSIRRHLIALFACVLALNAVAALSACKSSTSDGGASADGKVSVVASFYPMADFAQKIGGDHVEVTNLVPAGTEPHEWEPSSTDIKHIEASQLFIYNGADMESWVDDTLESIDTSKITVCEASKGLTLRVASEEGKDSGDHDHAGEHDPHVWLNPKNAKAELENIKDALVKADPKHTSDYEANYKKYAKEFDALDEAYRTKLSQVKGHSIVVSHEAYGYLCDAYGLTQMPITGMDAEGEPDAKTMAQIVEFVKDNDIKTVFSEDLVSKKVAKTIAKETGAQCVQLNPCEGLTDEQLKAGEDYLSVMYDNLDKLVAALNEE